MCEYACVTTHDGLASHPGSHLMLKLQIYHNPDQDTVVNEDE